ncbi:MAG: hypothetical protein EA383_15235, partial [Spirochaetaceae bacterium]
MAAGSLDRSTWRTNSRPPVSGTSPGSPADPGNLRCEYLRDPVAVDTAVPRLSWELRTAATAERCLVQSAYRVLVGSSLGVLEENRGDLWDSGKVPSGATAGIAYDGTPLTSRQRCYWKVRTWDEHDRPSEWSPASRFTMALLRRDDWKAAWITCRPQRPETAAHFGFLSRFADTPDLTTWVQIDLGRAERIDGVRLWGTWMTGRFSLPGGGFPLRFRVEISDDPGFSHARTVFDHTASDYPLPGLEPVLLELGSHEARVIRLTATKLSGEHDAVWDPAGAKWRAGAQTSSYLALAEMEVLGNGRNLAHGKPVTASDANEQECFNPPVDSLIAPCIHGGWSPDYLTDGRTQPDLGSRFRLAPVSSLRKEFVVEKAVRRATLYATALGSYEFSLNGEKIGDHVLAPPWTVFSKRVLYQTLDVTAMLKPGANTLAAMLGDGWFRMRGWDYFGSNKRFAGFYNADERWLLGQLEVEFTDGDRMTVATDRTWQTHGDGPFRYASMYDGVLYDERKELPGWDKPGFTGLQGWMNAVEGSPAAVPVLSSQSIPPVRTGREIEPASCIELRPGTFVYDFGEQIAGVCRIRVRGPRDSEVKLRFAQALDEDGSLYVANLMGSYDNQDVFVLDGQGVRSHTPLFTYHGFRYVEVTGALSADHIEELTALEIGSDLESNLTFSSSDGRLNTLVSIIDKAYRSNMPGIATDCAGRDERLPWLGDCFTVEVQSMCSMYDFAAFGANEVRVMHDALNSHGVCPPTLTKVADEGDPPYACWSDAAVVAPYLIWLNYEDRRSLEDG